MNELDQMDLKILRLLQSDANITNKEIARRVHLSTTPVYERIKKLEKGGFIQKYVAVLDKEKLDKGLIVFCNVTLKEHTKNIGHQFVNEITSLDEVVECYNISGDFDFLLKVIVQDMKAYQDFVLNKLGEIKNIGSAHSTFVMSEIKQSFNVPI
ncbi:MULTISPECIES: Lrp/AsnC family transcriptional regulator [Flammeovirga]|uniref:Lrp/AsnC family transcriptional regulator n=1 Tax=Flammeovirga agarivorans TaxID=2726742 RepID=A0A7X8XVD7_9BACT|nr:MULTISPECIES: Lrp/AsnC family transcriptional regulator [Flammeovirga]NLR91201.1 Lrp/AsnC family transcriptional regulator [Flammeovirga agarivorans]